MPDIHQYLPRLHQMGELEEASCQSKANVTHGFGTRGQVDLIDFQSMPDGEF